jgi:integrase/recombinase XerD
MSTSTATVLSVPNIPSIVIFVRHAADCPYRDDEGYKSCKCKKHFRYFVARKQIRQSAHTRVWKVAEQRRREMEQKFSADASAVVIAPTTQQTIEQSIALFVADKRSQGLSDSVLKKYTRELARFETAMSSAGMLFPHEITRDALTTFRSDWSTLYPSSQTRGKVQERLKAFLRYCYDTGKMSRVPVMTPIKVDVTPTLPLDDKQYARLLSACSQEFTGDKAKRTHALIQLMRHTGLAIMDAVTLERSELTKTGKHYRVTTSREKTGTNVSVLIPDAVAKEVLSAAALNGSERFVFWNTGTGKAQSAVTNWQHDLRQCFRAAGMPNGHPHQLRDTFACGLLTAGVPLEEVSKALGHKSIKVTEKHYAAWVKVRQNRLDDYITGTWTK